MGDYNFTNATQDNSSANSNNTADQSDDGVLTVVTCITIAITFPLTLAAICAVLTLVRKDHSAPIYVINLLISDLIQLCCMIAWVPHRDDYEIMVVVTCFYFLSLMASIGFMVWIALERYLVIGCPLWYRFNRTIRTTIVVCVSIWVLLLFFVLILHFSNFTAQKIMLAVYFLFPLPLLSFFLFGTLRALSASRVPSDEKRRIVAVLVLVLLIYMLLFLPRTICNAAEGTILGMDCFNLSLIFLQLNPLADSFLYVFMRKGIIDRLLASVCCCRMESSKSSRADSNDVSSTLV